jgi:hypothetical protein
VKRGDRIAQLIIERIYTPEVLEVQVCRLADLAFGRVYSMNFIAGSRSDLTRYWWIRLYWWPCVASDRVEHSCSFDPPVNYFLIIVVTVCYTHQSYTALKYASVRGVCLIFECEVYCNIHVPQ